MKTTHTDETNADLEALKSFVAAFPKRKKDCRYNIFFKQHDRGNQTYRSDLNYINTLQKFGKPVLNERIALLFLFADRVDYFQWFVIFDNNEPDGKDRIVFYYKNHEYKKNTVFKAEEIKLVREVIIARRNQKKSMQISAPKNGEIPVKRDINAVLNQVSRNFKA